MLSSLNRLSKLWRFADANRVATVKVSSMVEAPRKLDKKSYRKLKQETELSHAMERDPVVTKFLVETEPVLDRGKRRKQAESFWTYLSTYKTVRPQCQESKVCVQHKYALSRRTTLRKP